MGKVMLGIIGVILLVGFLPMFLVNNLATGERETARAKGTSSGVTIEAHGYLIDAPDIEWQEYTVTEQEDGTTLITITVK